MAADSTEFKLTGRLAVDPQHKCHIKLEAGYTSFAKEEPYFADDEARKTVYKQCGPKLGTEEKFCAKVSFLDEEVKATIPKQEVSDKRIPPSCLYAGDGHRVQRVLCCTNCEVGNPTCCSFSICQLPLRIATRELKSKCNRCGKRRHDSLTCSIAIRRTRFLAPRNRRRARCSVCAKPGHNRRTCAKGL